MPWSDYVVETPVHNCVNKSKRMNNALARTGHTPAEYIELMKILNCLSFDSFCEMMDRDPKDDPGEYASDKYSIMRKDFLQWLCELDSGNQVRVFDYAEKKQIWHELKR